MSEWIVGGDRLAITDWCYTGIEHETGRRDSYVIWNWQTKEKRMYPGPCCQRLIIAMDDELAMVHETAPECVWYYLFLASNGEKDAVPELVRMVRTKDPGLKRPPWTHARALIKVKPCVTFKKYNELTPDELK